MNGKRSRRRFVQQLGVVVAVAGLAGCSGGDGGDGGDGDGGSDGSTGDDGGGAGSDGGSGSTATPAETEAPTATPTEAPAGTATPAETEAPTATPGSDGSGGGGSEIGNYLADVGNFDGTVADLTGQGEVTVEVGADGNGGGFAYGPPAIRIDAGTTVVWDWIGQGGLHNVVAESGAFDSGDPVSGEQASFEFTFEETGIYLYFCSPHKALGMKGAIEVV